MEMVGISTQLDTVLYAASTSAAEFVRIVALVFVAMFAIKITLCRTAFGAAPLQTGVLVSAVVEAVFFQMMMMIGVDTFVSAPNHGATMGTAF